MTDILSLLDQEIYYNYLKIRTNPLSGDYSLNHLKTFHIALLKGTELLINSKPGVLRGQNSLGTIYQRDRNVFLGFGRFPLRVTTIHSQMSVDDINDLKETLKTLQVNKFSSLMTADFAKNLSKIYIKSDFIHPFYDVNTRTLGCFLNQFSNKCGFKTFFDLSEYKDSAALSEFYISRAKSVNKFGIKLLNKEDQGRLQTQMSRFSNFPDFSEFLSRNTLPRRAIAFNDLIADSAENSKGDLRLFLYNMHHNSQYILSSYPELKEPIDVLKGTIGHTIKNQRMTEGEKEIFINNAAQSACDLLAKGYHTFNPRQLYEECCKTLNINSKTKTDKDFDR